MLPDSSLLRLPNATLTPRIAGASQQAINRPTAMIAEEIHRYVAGEQPLRRNCGRETN